MFCNVILSHVVSVNIILVEVYLLLMLPIIVTLVFTMELHDVQSYYNII